MKASTRARSRGAAAFAPLILALLFVAPAAALAADLSIAADPSLTDPSASPSPTPDPSASPSPSPDPSASPSPSPTADPGASASPSPSPSPDPSASPSPDPSLTTDAVLVAYYFPQVDQSSGITIAAVAGVTSTQAWSPWRRTTSRTAWVQGLWTNLRAGATVTGRASWYPSTRGWRGVPAVALPGAWYRPRGSKTQRVEVCAGKRCLVVPVVDFCDCHVNTSTSRIVDLSRPLVRRLGLKLHKGIYTVTLRLVSGPTPT